MKRIVFVCVFMSLTLWLCAAGVLLDRSSAVYQAIRLTSCEYSVQVDDQTAEVMVAETFVNDLPYNVLPRLYFPIPRGANPTRLRWSYGEEWFDAQIAGIPEPGPGGPSSFPDDFVIYIQLMPLVFDAPDSMATGDSLSFELTYVQSLNMNFGSMTLNLKNDYSRIQTSPLNRQSLNIEINSNDSILEFDILDITAATEVNEHTATGSYTLLNQPATNTYRCVWNVANYSPGSWGLSTMLDEAPDLEAPGFFLYNFRENSLPADSSYALRLVLVIDVSGSMTYENRLQNAKDAASYIINNLQQNDLFNVIFFDHVVRPIWSLLMPNTLSNRNYALNRINSYTITSLNGTNLHGGMQDAISQLTTPPPGVKNCIILLSDGQPNVGVTDTYQIINQLNNQITSNHSDPYIFCFGIGLEVNYQLLGALSQHHHGLSIFLESAQLVNTVSSFWDVIRNPIFVTSNLSVSPANAVFEIFPDPFPSLYGGMQYRILGRYNTAQNISMQVSGNHVGVPHVYTYQHNLSSEESENYSFIPKLWAGAKIDKLLLQYYSYPEYHPQAIALRQQIIDLSIQFGVVCVFTSFINDPPIANEDEYATIEPPLRLLQNYPNPFNPSTTISFEVTDELRDEAELRIYNMKGQLVYAARITVNGKGTYEHVWHGLDLNNSPVASGVYIYSIRCGKYILHSKMTLVK